MPGRSGDPRRGPLARPARRGRRAPAVAARHDRRSVVDGRLSPLLPPLHGPLERYRCAIEIGEREATIRTHNGRQRRLNLPTSRMHQRPRPRTEHAQERLAAARKVRPPCRQSHERSGRSRRARHRAERRRCRRRGAPTSRRCACARGSSRWSSGRRAICCWSPARRRRCASTARSCRCSRGRSAARRSRTRWRRRWRRTRARCTARPASPTDRSARRTSAASASTCTTSAAAPPRRSAACRPPCRASRRSTCRRRSKRSRACRAASSWSAAPPAPARRRRWRRW